MKVYCLFSCYHIDCYKRSESGASIVKVGTDYKSLLRSALIHNIHDLEQWGCTLPDPYGLDLESLEDKLLADELTLEQMKKLQEMCLDSKTENGEFGLQRTYELYEIQEAEVTG